MKSLKIGDLLARIPIIQGGMGVGISLSGLASAVANEGGVGFFYFAERKKKPAAPKGATGRALIQI